MGKLDAMVVEGGNVTSGCDLRDVQETGLAAKTLYLSYLLLLLDQLLLHFETKPAFDYL